MEEFEKIHRRLDWLVPDLCYECRGYCCQNCFVTLLPGETGYLADKLFVSEGKFIKDFCQSIEFSEEKIFILKHAKASEHGCLFLNEYKCELEKLNSKPIQCLLYPVSIHLWNDELKIYTDHWECPMADHIPDNFRHQAIAVYESIKNSLPEYWLRFVSKYEEYYYNILQLVELEKKAVLTAADLEGCIRKSCPQTSKGG